MKRTLNMAMMATEFEIELEDVIHVITELLEEGVQHGIVNKENQQFYHLTPDEHNHLIALLSKEKVPIEAIAENMELPSSAITSWLNILVKSKKLNGLFNLDNTHFLPYSVMLTEVKDSFSKSGKLGITEAATALRLSENRINDAIQELRKIKELEGYYTSDNNYFVTLKRLEADLLDFLKDEKRFPIIRFASKVNMKEEVIIELIEEFIKRKIVTGAITKRNEYISDDEIEQALVEAVLPYSRMSISELAELFGFSEKNMKHVIARAISKGLITGSIDSVSNELVKERVSVPVKRVVPQDEELLDVKRDYDYLGSAIHFKVALRNITKTTVSKISVLLNVPDQFQIERNVEKVEILNPNETRGVDFIFTPLACGKGQIFGTVSYTDAFGEPHSVTIRPKEVWVKCPLVKSQTTSITEADSWRKELQKNTTKIDSIGVSKLEAFKTACEQIAALDLAEVIRNEVDFVATFSGIAKVTGDRLLVEISLTSEAIILDVFTSDQKQATGLLAYMRNLIRMSLEVSRKLHVKAEKLGSKVLTAFKIAQGLLNLCDYCEIHSAICDFILGLKEVIFKLNREFPEIKFVSEVNAWLEELSKLDENLTIPDNLANALEYTALVWLKETESLAETTAAIYLDSFDTPDDVRDRKIGGGLLEISAQIIQKESNYSLRIAHFLLIIHKISGLCLFNHKFSPGAIDPDLMSGFLQAIQSFGTEFSSSEEAGMKRLSYKDFEITLEESELARVALVGIGKITDFLDERLKEFVEVFSNQFQAQLVDFRGNVGVFAPTGEIIKKIFQ